eukprot:scaffold2498_cov74-Cyclotella_meneghiniana.AAC.7
MEEEFHGASAISLGANEEHAWWDDDDSEEYPKTSNHDCDSESATRKTATRKHRWRVWKNRSIERDPSMSDIDSKHAKSGAAHNVVSIDEEHPMRTDEWELDVKLSRTFPMREHDLFPECSFGLNGNAPPRKRFRKRQVMQFATNGYVKVIQDEQQLTSNNMDASFVPASPTACEKSRRGRVQIGKWKVGHNGVAFDIPVSLNSNTNAGEPSHQKSTVLHYHADIHLNKFGERPRMFRGVITRDRYSSVLPPNFLRPVIGTFSAQGTGNDTADTSYKERGFGLSRQQVISPNQKS